MPPSANSGETDVVVIGSGIAGCTAAAILAKAGLGVTVLEQGEGPGGCAHAFHRDGFTIDPAVHYIVDPPIFDGLLTHLGVRDRCRFLPVDAFYEARFPDAAVRAPLGSEDAFVQAHVDLFPDCEEGIRSFFGICSAFHRQAHELPSTASLDDLDELGRRAPEVLRHRRSTVAEVLEAHVEGDEARAACGIASWTMGLPPSRLAFQFFAQSLFSTVERGAMYAEGGAQTVADAVVHALERDGGTIEYGSPATRIVLTDRGAAGVEVSESVLRARAVVSAADATQTFERLVDPERLPPAFRAGFRRLRPSVSGFVLFVGTELDLRAAGLVHQTFNAPSWDTEGDYTAAWRGESRAIALYAPTIADPAVAPPGCHLLVALQPSLYEVARPWEEERPRRTEVVLGAVEELVPGLRERLLFVEAATPETLERYTWNRAGAIWGWEYSTAQAARRRPARRTPIPGLYLAGHWTHPGAGFLRSAVSGLHTAAAVLEDLGVDARDAIFRHPDLPPA